MPVVPRGNCSQLVYLNSVQVVYNEYIADRHHIHMNATNFLTLTDFVKHLGKEGLCRVDETPKGWFISLIMKDPMEHLSDARRIKRAKHEKASATGLPWQDVPSVCSC